MKMYAVSSGDYSYYRVHCLFPTEELAQAHADARNALGDYEKSCVEEYEVFERLPERVTWYEQKMSLYEDGSWPPEPNRLEPWDKTEWEYEAPQPLSDRPHLDLIRYPAVSAAPGSVASSASYAHAAYYSFSAYGRDRGNVASVVSETHAQWLAQNFTLNNAREHQRTEEE